MYLFCLRLYSLARFYRLSSKNIIARVLDLTEGSDRCRVMRSSVGVAVSIGYLLIKQNTIARQLRIRSNKQLQSKEW